LKKGILTFVFGIFIFLALPYFFSASAKTLSYGNAINISQTALADVLEPRELKVEIISRFGATNEDVIETKVDARYGNILSFSEFLPEEYELAFWLINGRVRFLPRDHEFVVTDDMTIEAVFKHETKHVVLFMDSNGSKLDLQYVDRGEDALEPAHPHKPGFEFIGWSGSYENVTEDRVLLAQYEQTNNDTFTLIVEGGHPIDTNGNNGTYPFNAVATVEADLPIEGQHFSHWEINGKVVSKQRVYSFTMLRDVTIKAAYTDEIQTLDLPYVTLSEKYTYIMDGKDTYVGQFYLPENYLLVEYGLLTSYDVSNPVLEQEGVTKYQSHSLYSESNEWIVHFNADTNRIVRAYLVYKDNEELKVVYSDVIDVFAPVIVGVEDTEVIIQVEAGEFDLLEGISVYDDVDDLTIEQIILDIRDKAGNKIEKIDLTFAGEYIVTYTIQDSAGNVTEAIRSIKVYDRYFVDTNKILNGDFLIGNGTPPRLESAYGTEPYWRGWNSNSSSYSGYDVKFEIKNGVFTVVINNFGNYPTGQKTLIQTQLVGLN